MPKKLVVVEEVIKGMFYVNDFYVLDITHDVTAQKLAVRIHGNGPNNLIARNKTFCTDGESY